MRMTLGGSFTLANACSCTGSAEPASKRSHVPWVVRARRESTRRHGRRPRDSFHMRERVMSTSVEGLGGVAAPAGDLSTPTGPAPGEAPPTLPGDTTMLLYLSGRNEQQRIRAQGAWQAHQRQQAAAERQARFEAMKKQLEKKEDQSFWETVGTIAKVVAVAA